MWRRVVFVFLFVGCSAQTPDLIIKMKEESPVNTYIGNISDSRMFQNISQVERSSLKFGILNKNSKPANLFNINTNSGTISVRGRIDREDLCDFTDVCQVQFDVAVHSDAFSNVATVFVELEDINDNSPTFGTDSVAMGVSELASVGTILKISGASDRDSMAENTIQRYEMTRHTDLFSLTPEVNLDGSSVINLEMLETLDREKRTRYTFNIIAYDGGKPPRTGMLSVVINVIDENDNTPKFRNASYSISVKEDDPVNTTVLVVTANDPDLGDNGKVRYQFSSLQSSKLHSLFSIDSETGEIKVAGKLEYETDTPQSLIVEALDTGDSPRKSQVVVTVQVLDSGNNRPVVRVNTLAAGNTVLESANHGFFVAYVEVEDSDTGENGDVTCDISDSDFALEPLSGKKGYKVIVNNPLDRETKSKYNMTIVCRDNGKPPLAGYSEFPIIITDVNDNDPVFTRAQYTLSLEENSPIGRSVITLTALDADSRDNSKLNYYVVESSKKQSFRIENDQGIITTNRMFDREKEPLIKFSVLAVDSGIPARTGTTQVTLHITDINDMFPVFEKQIFEFSILENLKANSFVGNITASDEDAGLNGEVEFFMAESPDGKNPFIVLSNGTVIAEEPLDREFQRKYIFTVLARDKGTPPKTNSSEVSITVLDANDNVPSILFPTTYNHTIFISRAPELNSVIGKIVAYDPDFAENASLVFNISAGNVDEAFAIDPLTGEAKVASLWKLQNDKIYDLTIMARDSGAPPLATITHLIVDVQFTNETIPIPPPKSDKYVVIAAVVAASTIVLSIIILAAIFFVLRSDRRKTSAPESGGRLVGHNPPPSKPPAPIAISSPMDAIHLQTGLKGGNSNLPSSNAMFPNLQHEKQSDGHKKKEVSFSFDDSLDSKPRDMIISNSKFNFLDEKDKIIHLDDVHSDTSGETIPSDSGRGGSEEEMNIQLDKKSHLSRWETAVPGSKVNSFNQCYPLPPKHNMAVPNTRNSQVRFLHTNSLHEGRDFKNTSAKNSEMTRGMPYDSQRDYLMRNGRNTFQDRSRDYSRPISYGRQSSTMSHDDDGSTTTSGSYTINHDDYLDDRIMGKDVIV